MRTVLVAVLIVCLAAAAWFVVERTDTQLPPDAPVDSPTTAIESAAAAPVSSAVPGTATEAPIHGAVEADATERRAATPVITGPSAEIQVVLFETKAPVAEATVRCWPPDFDWQKMTAELQELARTDNDELLKRVGLVFTTDAEGCCRVPLAKSGTQVNVVKDELWGQGYLRRDTAERTVVALRADHTLRVRVVDAGGKPAPGASLLGTRTGGKNPMSWQMGQTDADGRFAHRHIQQFAGDDSAKKVEFVASTPGCESPPVPIDVTAPPAEVLLRLPPAAS